MVESLNKNFEKRVIFPSREQHKFLLKLSKVSGLSWLLIARKMGISKRTLFDWRREKYSMAFGPLEKICNLIKVDFPVNIEVRSPFWSVKKAAKLGGITTYRKYKTIGDPLIRKQRWAEWWGKIGKYNPNKYFIAKEIFKPERSNQLAEFVGIVMGDGGITEKQLTITLNSNTDKLYSVFVEKLIYDLFKVRPGIYLRKNEATMRIVVSRTNLIKFCQSLGLKVGNKLKQNLDIPDWIKENREFLIASIRGLMDTDGSLFMERHKIRGKIYSYPRLSLVSHSKPLRQSVYKTLKKFGFSPRIRGERCVQLETNFDIERYFDKIGTSHPKNQRKFLNLFGGVG